MQTTHTTMTTTTTAARAQADYDERMASVTAGLAPCVTHVIFETVTA